MKINLISLNNGHSLKDDIELLSYTIKKLYINKKTKIEFHNYLSVQGSIADVNIFVGIINYSLLKYAPINILIVDPHKFNIKWIPFLERLDYVIVKTQYSYDIMTKYISKDKIFNIGWKAKDYFNNSISKDYNSFLSIMGYSNYRQLDKLLEVWKPEYPKLTILLGPNYIKNNCIEKKDQENIEYIDKYLPDDEFEKLVNEKGIHLCLSSSTSFANTLQLCQSVKSIPVTLDCIFYKNFVTKNINGFLVKIKKKGKNKHNLGSDYKLDTESFQETIEKIIDLQKNDDILLEEMTEKNKSDIRINNREFDKNFKNFFDIIWKQHSKTKNIKRHYEIYDEDLPFVSIITPTRNRKNFFKLAIRNFNKTDYPEDKIEWIIIDDGEEEIENLLPNKNNIIYQKITDKVSIGKKRNIAVEKAKGEYIVCMDDDDYYLPQSVKFRLASLVHLNKKVVSCSSLGILEINKIISNLNISSYLKNYSDRIYEHTMAFRKSHWENNKFLDVSKNEGKSLVENNIKDYDEINWESICVTLKHQNNINTNIKINGETNGSHFNLNDEVFELITNIEKDFNNDLQLKSEVKEEKENIVNEEQIKEEQVDKVENEEAIKN